MEGRLEYLYDAWYVAAVSAEFPDDGIFAREFLGVGVAMFRQADGSLAAVRDQCPHRFAPLSRGNCIGGTIECKYHGLRFNGQGECVLNPHGDVIPPNAHIRHFPVEDRFGLVWIWMGAPDRADRSKIPDLEFLQQGDQRRTIFNYIFAEYRSDILVDNLVDLSHADYLHVGSFSGGPGEDTQLKVWEEGDAVVAERVQLRAPAPPIAGFLGSYIDATFHMRWQPGNVLSYSIRMVSSDPALQGEEFQQFAHFATPANHERTHYFMALTRPLDGRDPPIEVRAANQRRAVSEEDGPMLMAVHQQMDGRELMSLNPLVLPTDAASLRIRRVIKRLKTRDSADLMPLS